MPAKRSMKLKVGSGSCKLFLDAHNGHERPVRSYYCNLFLYARLA